MHLRRALFCTALSLLASVPGGAQQPRTLARVQDFRVDVDAGAGSIRVDDGTIAVDSRNRDSDAWSLQMQTKPIASQIRKGDVFCFRFDARALASPQGSDPSLSVTVAKSDPFQTIQENNGYRTILVSPRWHSFAVYFRSDGRFDAGQVIASLHFAGNQQRLELRELSLISYGQAADSQLPQAKLYYESESANEAWRSEAERRIAKHRMTDLRVKVIDGTGNPIPNAAVRIQQTRHAYAFGTFVGETPVNVDADAERFRQKTKEWFNRVTLPRYWADWGTDSPDGLERADGVARWAAESGFELKTHLLLYPQFLPDRVKAIAHKPDEFRREIELAMRDALQRTKDLNCNSWDAINELRDVTLVGDVLGEEYYASVFNLANQSQPNSTWFINEYGIFTGGANRQEFLQTYIQQIKSIQANGGAVEGIGVQGHFSESLVSMPEVWRTLDRLAEFKLPIEITEFDVDTSDVETQATFTQDFLTAVFAHPATTGLTTWGFWEGDMWRPKGAMFRKDWSMKPNGRIWKDLIFKRWWTNKSLATDGLGTASVRAFKGSHRIRAEVNGRVIDQMIDTGDGNEVVLRFAE